MKKNNEYLFADNFVICKKIWAVGSYKCFAWFEVEGETFCVRINDKFYSILKKMGVPTSQSLRGKK